MLAERMDFDHARQTLLVDALVQSAEELSDVERCFRAWVVKQQQVLSDLAALSAATPHAELVTEAERLKSGEELEDLLRSISTFPLSLDHALMQMPATIEHAPSPDGTIRGRERIMVKRAQSVQGGSVKHEWAPFYCTINAEGVLLLFQSTDAVEASAVIPLARYCWEYAGGGRETKEGLHEMHLCCVEASTDTLPAPTSDQVPGIMHDANSDVGAERSSPGAVDEEIKTQDIEDKNRTSPASTQPVSSAPTASSGMQTGSQQATLVGRWAGALSLKLRPVAASTPESATAAAVTDGQGGAVRRGASGRQEDSVHLQSPAQQPVVKWWQGLTNLGKLGKGKEVAGGGGKGAGDDAVSLRADSPQQTQRLHECLQAHCCASIMPILSTPTPTTPNTVDDDATGAVPSSAAHLDVHSVPTMTAWQLVVALKDLDVWHEVSSPCHGRACDVSELCVYFVCVFICACDSYVRFCVCVSKTYTPTHICK